MIIVPKEKPVKGDLNTYYINVDKMLEHFQGEIGSGGVFFKSTTAQGVVFFDKDELLNAFFQEKDKKITGQEAIDYLLNAGFSHNFKLDVYRIAQEEVYFWSSLTTAEILYNDLSTDSTDLESLIKQSNAEKLTGIIEATIKGSKEGGLIFISNGELIGGSFSWFTNDQTSSKKNMEILSKKLKEHGGGFKVYKIPLNSGIQNGTAAASGSDAQFDVITMLEDLFRIFETLYTSKKNSSSEFKNVLRKKFVEKADEYHFLDPFAAEFEYSNNKITFTGDADGKTLADGVILSVKELAEELGLLPELQKYLSLWYTKYQKQLADLGIHF